MESVVLGTITSFLVVLFSTPVLIKVSKLKHLVDEPGEDRKLHHRSIPTIGGTIIFASVLLSYALWFPYGGEALKGHSEELIRALWEFKFLVASILVLFFIGIKDDIIGTAPSKKIVAQILVGFMLVVVADIRIEGLHGLFGVESIPEWASILLSMFVYIVITNAYNLIDGVDGLATGMGVINSFFFGCWFMSAGDLSLGLLSFTLTGALLGFLIFNFSPAKVFMGDSGSLTTGLILSYLAIRLIEHEGTGLNPSLEAIPEPIYAMGVLAYPLIDTLRIFFIRALKGRSPLEADQNHIHHKLMKLGLKHRGTVLILYIFNITVVGLVFMIRLESITYTFILHAILAFGLALVPFLFKSRYELE